jgi:hypothetical protein
MAPRWQPSERGKKKTQHENAKVQKEVTAAGDAFAEMNNRLAQHTKATLWRWAMEVSKTSEGTITPPDRTERRMKAALVCWYCKWAPDFPRGFPPPPSAPENPLNPHPRGPPLHEFSLLEEAEKDESIDERWL